MKPFFKTLLLTTAVIISQPLWAEVAPDFTLKSNQGENIKRSDLLGEVVMINFWATWCGPCRKEMPALDKLYQRYESAGFTVLGVNVETDVEEVDQYLAKNPVSFPVLYDVDSIASKAFNVKAMPTTVFLDRDGNVRDIHKAYKAGDEAKYRDIIRKLLSEL